MLTSLLLGWCAVASSCGGGGSSSAAEVAAAPASIATPTSESTSTTDPAAALPVIPLSASILAAAASAVDATVAAAASTPTASPTTLAGDATQPTALLGSAATLVRLAQANPNGQPTQQGLGATSQCRWAYTPPAALSANAALPLPASGGTFYTANELATWKARTTSGPYLVDGDQQAGSPGDWRRIQANAQAIASRAEAALTSTSSAEARDTHGIQARDAAFHFLLTGTAASGTAARAHLLAQAANPANDLAATLCITTSDGTTFDAWFHHAAWLLRHAVAYDFVRGSFTAAQRLTVENWLRRNAYFLAAHTDWGITNIFPSRAAGNYNVRQDAAAATTDADKWALRRFDTNGDCSVNEADQAQARSMSAYVRADGSLGPRISVLSQYFNNRKSTATAAFGSIGVLLGDANLIASAKRYFMEWLSYSVAADGSQGEYLRNGDYCIAPQGVVYAWLNLQGAALVSRVLARRGDRSLISFSTRDGLFGTESGSAGAAKSLALVAATHQQLANGRLAWFSHEPWKAAQAPRAATSLGATTFHYLGHAQALDDFHELGLLPIAPLLGNTTLSGWILRDKAATSLPFPGASGNAVATGLGAWSDAFNAMPAVLLLRP